VLFVEGVYLGGGPDVGLFEDEDTALLVDKNPLSDIEFSLLDQLWLFHILLDDEVSGLKDLRHILFGLSN